MAAKKLTNRPADCVKESLLGYVRTHPNTRLLKNYDVVVREDLKSFVSNGRVPVVSGGGSGHEPAHIGYVGQGMLSAAVCGAVFTSPPVSSIIATLRACSSPHGVLVVVKNYTGDRLNFGKAIEHVKADDIRAEMIVVADDCALHEAEDHAGKRGLCGTVIVHKIAGAMSERGCSLEQIVSYLNDVVTKLDLSNRFPFDICAAQECIKQRYQKVQTVLHDGFSGAPALITTDWQGPNQPNRTYLIRLSVHGFHHLICWKSGFHCPEDQCVCSQCDTISISLSPCSLPGQPATFEIAEDETEFGLGIHGEPGVKTIKLSPAASMTELMLSHVEECRPELFKTGNRIALIVNNLGATTNIELYVVVNEALRILDGKGLIVDRCFHGAFMTSLNMAGVSLTLFAVDQQSLKYLDAETNAPGWPRGDAHVHNETYVVVETEDATLNMPAFEVESLSDAGRFAYVCLEAATSKLLAAEEELNELDRSGGDGDCGYTLARGAAAIKARMGTHDVPRLPFNSLSSLFRSVADIVETSAGGSSGALIAILLLRMSTRFRDGASFSDAFSDGVAALMSYGGAKPGDRTMIDALMPAATALESMSRDQSLSVQEKLQKMAEAANQGAMATVTMTSRSGRSSYVSSEKLVKADPGAVAVAMVIKAIADESC